MRSKANQISKCTYILLFCINALFYKYLTPYLSIRLSRISISIAVDSTSGLGFRSSQEAVRGRDSMKRKKNIMVKYHKVWGALAKNI